MLILNFNGFDEAKKFYDFHKESINTSMHKALDMQNVIDIGDVFTISTVHLSDDIKGLSFKVSNCNIEDVSLEMIEIVR